MFFGRFENKLSLQLIEGNTKKQKQKNICLKSLRKKKLDSNYFVKE